MNNYIKKNIGWILIMVLVLIPVLRWFFIVPLNSRFADIGAIATSLGQITGLLGMILFALSLITGSKFKFIDKIFFVPRGFDAIGFGIYALALMILLIILTLYIKLKYQIWLFSHRFLILAFIFAVLHSFMIESDISRDLFLRYYMLGFSFFALALSLYNLLADKIFFQGLEYYVSKVNKLTENITQIELSPKSNALKFMPGQFVFVRFLSKGISSESHPFTVSSISQKENIELNIKSLGDYSSKIKDLKVGEKAFIKGPFGKFSYTEFKDKNQIWIAGGIGITPFLSMARSLRLGNVNQKADLYYCVKNKSEAILLDELLEIEKNNKSFRLMPWFSEEKGQITADKIVELSNGFVNKEIFLCGPTSFMIKLKSQLLKLGVNNINIHWEKFSF